MSSAIFVVSNHRWVWLRLPLMVETKECMSICDLLYSSLTSANVVQLCIWFHFTFFFNYKFLVGLLVNGRWGRTGRGRCKKQYFLTGCVAQGLKPLLISRDFSPSKKWLIWLGFFFCWNFCKSGPIFEGFLPQKQMILQFLLQFLWNGTLF